MPDTLNNQDTKAILPTILEDGYFIYAEPQKRFKDAYDKNLLQSHKKPLSYWTLPNWAKSDFQIYGSVFQTDINKSITVNTMVVFYIEELEYPGNKTIDIVGKWIYAINLCEPKVLAEVFAETASNWQVFYNNIFTGSTPDTLLPGRLTMPKGLFEAPTDVGFFLSPVRLTEKALAPLMSDPEQLQATCVSPVRESPAYLFAAVPDPFKWAEDAHEKFYVPSVNQWRKYISDPELQAKIFIAKTLESLIEQKDEDGDEDLLHIEDDLNMDKLTSFIPDFNNEEMRCRGLAELAAAYLYGGVKEDITDLFTPAAKFKLALMFSAEKKKRENAVPNPEFKNTVWIENPNPEFKNTVWIENPQEPIPLEDEPQSKEPFKYGCVTSPGHIIVEAAAIERAEKAADKKLDLAVVFQHWAIITERAIETSQGRRFLQDIFENEARLPRKYMFDEKSSLLSLNQLQEMFQSDFELKDLSGFELKDYETPELKPKDYESLVKHIFKCSLKIFSQVLPGGIFMKKIIKDYKGIKNTKQLLLLRTSDNFQELLKTHYKFFDSESPDMSELDFEAKLEKTWKKLETENQKTEPSIYEKALLKLVAKRKYIKVEVIGKLSRGMKIWSLVRSVGDELDTSKDKTAAQHVSFMADATSSLIEIVGEGKLAETRVGKAIGGVKGIKIVGGAGDIVSGMLSMVSEAEKFGKANRESDSFALASSCISLLSSVISVTVGIIEVGAAIAGVAAPIAPIIFVIIAILALVSWILSLYADTIYEKFAKFCYFGDEYDSPNRNNKMFSDGVGNSFPDPHKDILKEAQTLSWLIGGFKVENKGEYIKIIPNILPPDGTVEIRLEQSYLLNDKYKAVQISTAVAGNFVQNPGINITSYLKLNIENSKLDFDKSRMGNFKPNLVANLDENNGNISEIRFSIEPEFFIDQEGNEIKFEKYLEKRKKEINSIRWEYVDDILVSSYVNVQIWANGMAHPSASNFLTMNVRNEENVLSSDESNWTRK